ncbi:MAG: hypothetical protein IT373_12945 [Polyangiaceae bacterium]|nr:hypothetical protein [Polyangiaceae bacterium]
MSHSRAIRVLGAAFLVAAGGACAVVSVGDEPAGRGPLALRAGDVAVTVHRYGGMPGMCGSGLANASDDLYRVVLGTGTLGWALDSGCLGAGCASSRSGSTDLTPTDVAVLTDRLGAIALVADPSCGADYGMAEIAIERADGSVERFFAESSDGTCPLPGPTVADEDYDDLHARLHAHAAAGVGTCAVDQLSGPPDGAPCTTTDAVCDYWKNGSGGDDDFACRATCGSDGRWRTPCVPCLDTPGQLEACADAHIVGCP